MNSHGRNALAVNMHYYDAHAEEFCRKTLELDMRELYPPFLDKLSPGAHILDAGCGVGRDSKAFLDRGFVVSSIDASPGMARLASSVTHQPCTVLSLQELDFHEAFDGIWACACLLHVPHHEMSDVMRRMDVALKSGGVLYVSLKEGKGEGISDGRFFSYYTVESFRALFQSFHNLKEVAFWRTDDKSTPEPTAVWLNFLFMKGSRP